MPDTRKKTHDASMATTENELAESGEGAILREIRRLKTELLLKIDEKAETHATEIRKQGEQLREEFKNTMEQVGGRVTALEARVSSLEEAESNHADVTVALQQEVAQLKRDVAGLEQRSEDLEARSRRCNLRILGVKERREEGKNITEYVAQLLKESLGLEKTPVLDRAHRTLRERPGDDQPARAFVVKCHYLQERELLMKKAIQKKDIFSPDGDRIRIQPDFTQKVARQRAAFNEVRGMLRRWDGIRFGLFYPAELRITMKDGLRQSFKDPKLAKLFVEKNWKPQE